MFDSYFSRTVLPGHCAFDRITFFPSELEDAKIKAESDVASIGFKLLALDDDSIFAEPFFEKPVDLKP